MCIRDRNHTNYNKDNYPDDQRVKVTEAPAGLKASTVGALEDFATGIRDADAMLGKLTEYFSQVDEPVIPVSYTHLVTFVPTRVKQLLVPYILHGELAIELPSIAEKKAYIAKQLTEETWESELRIEMPHKHYVNMTPAVADCRSRMYAELHGGKV